MTFQESQSQKTELVSSPKSNKSRSSSTNSLNSNSSSNTLLNQQNSELESSKKIENIINKPSNSQLNESLIKKSLQPHKEVLKESDIQVKIADLGNACWMVDLKVFV